MAGNTSAKLIKSGYSSLTGEVPLDVAASFSVSGSAAQGTSVPATIIPDPTQPAVTQSYVQVPPDEYWLVYGVYSPVQTPALDGYVQFVVNNKAQNITFGPLSQTYRNIFGYKSLSSTILAQPNSQIAPKLITAAANTLTTAVSVSVNIEIKRLPQNYTGKIVA